MSGSEILLILLAILVLFGADKIPGIARSLGKGYREIKKATDEIKEEFNMQVSDVVNEIKEIKKQGTEASEKVNKKVTDIFDIDPENKKDESK